jgi:hypothetical protein
MSGFQCRLHTDQFIGFSGTASFFWPVVPGIEAVAAIRSDNPVVPELLLRYGYLLDIKSCHTKFKLTFVLLELIAFG